MPPSFSSSPSVAHIESLDHEGRGVAHLGGKTVFIEGALPYETVSYQTYKKKPQFEQAQTVAVLKNSFMRSQPRCAHFAFCGGCALQHVEFNSQVALKQRVLEDQLYHIAKVRPEQILAPIYGQAWGYRHRARLSARWVEKKGGVLVGFHEKRLSYIADMDSCAILPARLSALIGPLRCLIARLSIYARIPQVEVAVGTALDVLVLRIMDKLTTDDEEAIRAFVAEHSRIRPLQIWLQPKGPESAYPFYPLDAPPLSYHLPPFNLELRFHPTDFTQINPAVNSLMVNRALNLLDPQPGERIADLFCGIGNFTLPIAKRGAWVHGLEGCAALVERARANALHNRLTEQTNFSVANLFETTSESFAALGKFDKVLLDPPRDGAVQWVKALTPASTPSRIVYISCHPATLARDAGVLVHAQGYTLQAAGIVNLFAHTAHIESMALFEKAPVSP